LRFFFLIKKKDFLRLFWPVLIEQILATTIGMVNTMMVSGVGETAISAVSIVDSLNYVIMNLFIAFATGATVVVAQRVGAKDFNGANDTASQSMTACVGTAAISGALFIIFGPQIVNLLFAGLSRR
jgi:Na+-driven multidrug efflux pump